MFRNPRRGRTNHGAMLGLFWDMLRGEGGMNVFLGAAKSQRASFETKLEKL